MLSHVFAGGSLCRFVLIQKMAGNSCFIAYRTVPSAWMARAVFQILRERGIDAFFDVESINQGDFRALIRAEIRRRPYFLPIFAPTVLERCKEPNDVLLEELSTAVQAERRVVPLVVPDFDRGEIAACLPPALAARYSNFNTVTLSHEYFDASMDKLCQRFLVPVEEAEPPLEPALARAAERMVDRAAAEAPVRPATLIATKHFERALAAVTTSPESATRDFTRGLELIEQNTPPGGAQAGVFNHLIYLELQARMRRENEAFVALSSRLKAEHDKARAIIDSMI